MKTELAAVHAAVARAQERLAAAKAHNTRVKKHEAYYLERVHHHAQDSTVRSEEELDKRVHADMEASRNSSI